MPSNLESRPWHQIYFREMREHQLRFSHSLKSETLQELSEEPKLTINYQMFHYFLIVYTSFLHTQTDFISKVLGFPTRFIEGVGFELIVFENNHVVEILINKISFKRSRTVYVGDEADTL